MGATYHPLLVESIEPVSKNAVCVTFALPEHTHDAYLHTPGQHVTIRAVLGDEDVRRSYSICSPPQRGLLQIGVKHLPGGIFSTHVHKNLAVGDVLDVSEPRGEFALTPDPEREAHHIAIVAGSGITPVLSMFAAALAEEPESRCTLIYGNRDSESVMFIEELDQLKSRYPDRFAIVHVFTREQQSVPLFDGRLTEEKLMQLFGTVVDAASGTDWYICGPDGVSVTAAGLLSRAGVPADRIRSENFRVGMDAQLVVAEPDTVGSEVRVTLLGRTSTLVIDPDGAPILDHVLAARPEAPFACRSGACASCRAVITSGTVDMDRNWSLEDSEVAAGHVLTCQAHPTSDTVALTYDV